MELRNLPEYKELLQLKRLKKKTLQDIREEKIRVQHIGYKVRNNLTTTVIQTFCSLYFSIEAEEFCLFQWYKCDYDKFVLLL